MAFGMWSLTEGLDQVALYEQEDEQQDERDHSTTDYQMKLLPSQKQSSLSGETLIIAVGTAANAFLEIYTDISECQHVAEFAIISPDNEQTTKVSSKQRTCYLYRQNEGMILCMLKYHVDGKHARDWIRSLMSSVTVKNIAVLCSSPKTGFVGGDETTGHDSADDILRCLTTSSVKVNMKTPLLEYGNMINELPAAVLCYSEAFDRRCTVYIAYTESHFVDVFTLKCFQQVFRDDSMKLLKQMSGPMLTKRLRDFEGCGVADNNVYI